MPLTPAEIAEAERKKKAEEDASMASQLKQGLMDKITGMLNPANWGFGGIFEALIGAAVVCVFACTKWGKEVVQWGEDFVREHISPGFADTIHEYAGKLQALVGGTLSKYAPGLATTFGADNMVGEFLEGKSLDEIRALMKDKMPPSVINVITKDKATWDAFINTVKGANGGKIGSEDTFYNAPSLVALLTSQQPQVKAIADGLLATIKDGKGTTAADADTKKKIFASLQAIAKDSAMLGTLLNNDNRARTIEVLSQVAPDAKLDALLKNPLMIDAAGKPTTLLQQILIAKLTTDAQGNLQTDQQVTATVLQSDILKNDPAMAAALVKQQVTAQIGQANSDRLASVLGDQKLLEFAPIAASKDPVAIRTYAFQNLTAFKQFADGADIASLPADMQPSIAAVKSLPLAVCPPLMECAKQSGVDPDRLKNIFIDPKAKADAPVNHDYVVAQMLNRDNRQLIRDCKIENIAAVAAAYSPENAAMLTAHNIELILNVGDSIGQNATNDTSPEGQKKAQNSRAVMQALTDYLVDKKKAPLEKLNGQQIADFFSNNQAAATDLIRGLEGVTGEEGKVLAALRVDWEWDDGTKGLLPLLANGDGAGFVIDHMLHPSNAVSSFFGSFDHIASPILRVHGGVISENKDVLIDFGHRMEVIHVDAPSAPTQAQNNQQTRNLPPIG